MLRSQTHLKLASYFYSRQIIVFVLWICEVCYLIIFLCLLKIRIFWKVLIFFLYFKKASFKNIYIFLILSQKGVVFPERFLRKGQIYMLEHICKCSHFSYKSYTPREVPYHLQAGIIAILQVYLGNVMWSPPHYNLLKRKNIYCCLLLTIVKMRCPK